MILAESAKQLGKMMEHLKSKSTQTNTGTPCISFMTFAYRWPWGWRRRRGGHWRRSPPRKGTGPRRPPRPGWWSHLQMKGKNHKNRKFWDFLFPSVLHIFDSWCLIVVVPYVSEKEWKNLVYCSRLDARTRNPSIPFSRRCGVGILLFNDVARQVHLA